MQISYIKTIVSAHKHLYGIPTKSFTIESQSYDFQYNTFLTFQFYCVAFKNFLLQEFIQLKFPSLR